jgi:hypothetical protein
MTLIAHAAHTLTTIAYIAPVVGFLGWLGFIVVRDRLRDRGGPEGGGGRSGAD